MLPATPIPLEESERQILAVLEQGEREIAEGVGFDLEEVLAEADAFLDQSGT